MDSEAARRFALIERRLQRLEAKPGPLSQVGSFVPALAGSGTAGTFTYTANTSVVEWTRLGNRLHFQGRIVITAITVAPVGNMLIMGFPYAGVSDATMAVAGGGVMFGWRGITLPAGFTQVSVQMTNTATSLQIIRQGSNQVIGVVQGAEIVLVTGQLDFRFEGQYRVA
jgi:hypothetical protein